MIERTEDHKYFWTDEAAGTCTQFAGLTSVLIEQNLIDDDWFTDEGKTRGTIVHAFGEYVARNEPPPLFLPEDVVGYLVALRAAFNRHQFEVIGNGVEEIVFNVARRVAGTLDFDVHFEGHDATVDVKTGSPEPWHGLQTAAYSWMKYGPKWIKRKRYGLHLRPSGQFKLVEHSALDDLDRFMQALDLFHWRVRHGSFERPYGRSKAGGGRPVIVGGEGAMYR